MATKKFIIEVEEGVSKCSTCPLFELEDGCTSFLRLIFKKTCNHYNLSTMKIKELEENNERRNTN